MSVTAQLAIVIPAYKARYLHLTLESLCWQTDRDFRVYIGDDAGDLEISEIVARFKDNLNITYKRFEENLGNASLVAHWNRCLEMAAEEEWLWLFSDDDLMSPDCVANFKRTLTANKTAKIFRHDSVKFINDLEIIRENVFEDTIDTVTFLKSKFGYLVESYVVEYIFHKDLLRLSGGFRDLPLGWCADDLFWALGSQYTSIVKIPGTKVFWRFSELNISGKSNSSLSSGKKLRACHSFLSILKRSGILSADIQLKPLAVSWYFDQFNYLKINLGYFDRMVLLSRMFAVFPFEMFRGVFIEKLSKSAG